MTNHELHQAFARLRRLSDKVEEKSGAGFVDIYLDEDGEVHLHRVAGTKSINEFEDELLNAIVWAWNIKDYLKEAAKACGRDPRAIEKLVDRSESLLVLSDLANGAKHGKLRESRSGHFATLGEIVMSIPQQAVSRISFTDRRVDTDVADSSLVEFSAPVFAQDGSNLGEAGKILAAALTVWEQAGLAIATERPGT